MQRQKKNFSSPSKQQDSSWEGVKNWYDRLVGEKGHYFHQTLILPNALRLLELNSTSQILDLGCGQGVFSRHIPQEVSYCGVDISEGLIREAKKYNRFQKHQFFVGNASEPLPVSKKDFTHASFILCLQNMEKPEQALAEAAKHLQPGGKLLLILNHPCFRIPRQTSWGEDAQNKQLFRRINRYMSPLKIPIAAYGEKNTPDTFSFHYSLSDLSGFLSKEGFAILKLEEWCSDKTSTGEKAKSENFARNEFPLFLAILASKK